MPAIPVAVGFPPADLVVMGTHGHSGFVRWTLGSVTEKVLRRSPCPVLTVGPAGAGAVAPEGGPVFKRILCALDFSPSSDRALRYALSLAQEADARLSLLHVLDWPLEEPRDAGGFDLAGYRRRLEEEARERLRAAVPEAARDWCKPEERLEAGRPWQAIVRVAGELGAELIVMGVQGRGALDLMLFGSTTHNVVREAACPVLTIRAA
jgi:nucleotide-binding universal stress UspA family protein